MFDLFKPSKYLFLSSKSLDYCIKTLETKIDKPHISFMGGFTGKSEVLGTIYGQTFQIHKKREYRQSILPIWNGKFKPVSNGTIIELSFSLSGCGILAAIFMSLGLILLLLAISCFNVINIIQKSDFFSFIYLVICLSLIFGLILGLAFAKIVSSSEEEFFIDFFEKNFESKKIRQIGVEEHQVPRHVAFPQSLPQENNSKKR